MKRLIAFGLSVACVCVMTSCASAEEKSYQEAVELRNEGEYEQAIEILKGIQSYQDSSALIVSSYECLIDESLNNCNYDEALAYIEALGAYKDTAEMLTDTVRRLYQNGDITSDYALEYSSAYDLLDDDSQAFVDFIGVRDEPFWIEITGIKHVGPYEDAEDSYIFWYTRYNTAGQVIDDYTFFLKDGDDLWGEGGTSINRMVQSASADPSYDYEMIDLALRG